MSENEEIVYVYKNKVYLNITNRCPCACTFCIRSKKNAIGEASNLWLDHSPSFEEVKQALDNFNFDGYDEVIFCGYGEPTEAFDVLVKTARYLREKLHIKLRVNTNGLGSLINGRDISKELCDNVDAISISLNCSNKEDYYKIVRPKFGIESYDEKYRKSVSDLFTNLWQTEPTKEKFGKVFEEFSVSIRRFQVMFSTLPQFIEIFRQTT